MKLMNPDFPLGGIHRFILTDSTSDVFANKIDLKNTCASLLRAAGLVDLYRMKASLDSNAHLIFNSTKSVEFNRFSYYIRDYIFLVGYMLLFKTN